MADTGTTQLFASCFVPGNTFHVILTPSWASRSMNSAIPQFSTVLIDYSLEDLDVLLFRLYALQQFNAIILLGEFARSTSVCLFYCDNKS